MASTVTVRDSVRHKIKRLVALLDTTQGDIVEQAIKLFESKILATKKENIKNRKVKRILEEAEKIVEQDDPEWAETTKIIKSAQIDIDEFVSTSSG